MTGRPAYRGTVRNGPWAGQYIEADMPIVPHDMLKGGHYSYSAEHGWIWVPAPRPSVGEGTER